MKNPYEVLGVRQGASKEELTKAYKALAKQYHPDQYGDNPLKTLAEEKMRDINEAYQSLVSKNSGTNDDFRSSGSSDSSFNDIRADIQRGNLDLATSKLNNITPQNAEWNFLMGAIHMRKGWYDSARTYIETACNLDPSNNEYRDAYNSLNNNNNQYRQVYRNNTGNGSICDMCLTIWCADSLCECIGGDLCSCC